MKYDRNQRKNSGKIGFGRILGEILVDFGREWWIDYEFRKN